MTTIRVSCALAALCLTGLLATGEAGAQESDSAGAEAAEAAEAQETAGSPGEKLNPYTGDEEVVAEGRKLYLKYNCYGCHGTMGGGGMGRAINDTEWAYGGDDKSVFETIRQGRQGGMPAFGSLLTEDETWKVIAYIRSFYKGDASAVVW